MSKTNELKAKLQFIFANMLSASLATILI